jgi:hypothetical protein
MVWFPPRGASETFDVWHDRAAFHFLTEPEDRAAYAQRVSRAVRSDGHVIIGTFAPDGPERCSGLPIVRHDAVSLGESLGRSPHYQDLSARMKANFEYGLGIASRHGLKDDPSGRLRFGQLSLLEITPGLVDNLYARVKVDREPVCDANGDAAFGNDGSIVVREVPRLRRAQEVIKACRRAWNVAHRHEPDAGGVYRPWPTRGTSAPLATFIRGVAAIRDAAGLPKAITFRSFRHGGFTTGGDADLSDSDLNAVGAKTGATIDIYRKGTAEQRRRALTRLLDERSNQQRLSTREAMACPPGQAEAGLTS